MKFDPNDARWAAYVLSELDAAESALVEKELKSSVEARELVHGLQKTAALLGLALEKLPSIEFSTDQRLAIENAPRKNHASEASKPEVEAGSAQPRWGLRPLALAAMVSATLLVIVATAVLVRWLPAYGALASPEIGAPVASPEMRLEISTPPTNFPASLAVSPDGRAIVYVAVAEGKSGLWIRSLDALSPRFLAGGDLVSHP